MEKKLKIKIKALGLLDLMAFKNLVPNRRKIIEKGSTTPKAAEQPMNKLAKSLHPNVQNLVVSEVIEEGGNIVSYRLTPDIKMGTEQCAFFKAGQYLSIIIEVDGSPVTRPVSISSSPKDALKGFYIVSIKNQADGFVSPFIKSSWKIGTKVKTSAPEGDFFYEPLRDSRNVIGIAGGCGITPFRSIAKAITEGTEDFNLTILYGNKSTSDIAFSEEFKEMIKKSEGKLKLINVLSDENPGDETETGFITKDLIQKYAPENKLYSIFMCGPQAMYNFVGKEIAELHIPIKYIRRELFGETRNIQTDKNYPDKTTRKIFKLIANINGVSHHLKASSTESILTSLERGGVQAPSRCRSGKCGYCRSRLISGEVFIPNDTDGRRAADLKFGYIHTCSSYPLSDIEIDVPSRQ